MTRFRLNTYAGRWLLFLACTVTTIAYWQGLSGAFLFDDYPNIVDNHGVQPQQLTLASLVTAALSSPSSEFKRPLASLSFAANYLATGLDPFWMKATNLLIHLLNGLVMFALARRLLGAGSDERTGISRTGVVAAIITAGWLLLPINLTGVLYVVQRMESLANLFVLLGLLGYVVGREQMISGASRRGLLLCMASVVLATGLGLTAKETAVMLPLYSFLVEYFIYHFRRSDGGTSRALATFYLLTLAVPLAAGLAWLLPGVLQSETWANRDFNLETRLLSEARVVVDYIGWTLLPTPHELSFYHDNFRVSSGLLSPWTTLASALFLAAMTVGTVLLRKRRPLLALGLALYLGCHLLTGSILPLELIYEHRNYFASFGLLLAVVPLLMAPATTPQDDVANRPAIGVAELERRLPFRLARFVLLACLMILWTAQTAFTAFSWGNPLRLAQELAARAPSSPRAQYELGRTYIIYSRYDQQSPFTRLAYAPLERAMALPESSILPEQALIFMNSRMGRPVKDAWWDSMISKLQARQPGVQDESSLAALTECASSGRCVLPPPKMIAAYLAALSHPLPSSRLLASYGEYAWTVLGDRVLGLRVLEEAVKASPNETAYRVTLIHMLVATGHLSKARAEIDELRRFDFGGRLSGTIDGLEHQLSTQAVSKSPPAHAK